MKSTAKDLLFAFVILNVLVIFASSEYGSALVDLEPLVATKGKLVETLDKYLKSEAQRLAKIKRLAQEYDKIYKTASKNVDDFLKNPINSYLLIKRLTTDWKFVLKLIEDYENKDPLLNLGEEQILPNDFDLEEAAHAIVRLQETYLFNTTDLVKGKVARFKGVTELTASDCFQVGLNAYNESLYDIALTWFQQTAERLDKDDLNLLDKCAVLDYYAYSAARVDDVELAFKLIKDIKKINPAYPNIQKTYNFYKKEVQRKRNESKDPKLKEVPKIIEEPPQEEDEIDQFLVDYIRYGKLCRGEQLRTPEQDRKLKCRYVTNGSKYLLLQPAKEEELNLDPRIVVYHDVIRDNDIEYLKELSEDLLERATVLNATTGVLEYAKYRTSKSGWLRDDSDPRVNHISRLIEEITGLTAETAEDLQMNKYGLGGHYLWHYDFRREEEFDIFASWGVGNRIATWLFYLSDVEAGGATVFPDLDVQIKPIKGSAGFWYNLFKSGKGDLRTKHAACPVITGKKWVANKWLHERGQEFRRKCDLDPNV